MSKKLPFSGVVFRDLEKGKHVYPDVHFLYEDETLPVDKHPDIDIFVDENGTVKSVKSADSSVVEVEDAHIAPRSRYLVVTGRQLEQSSSTRNQRFPTTSVSLLEEFCARSQYLNSLLGNEKTERKGFTLLEIPAYRDIDIERDEVVSPAIQSPYKGSKTPSAWDVRRKGRSVRKKLDEMSDDVEKQ